MAWVRLTADYDDRVTSVEQGRRGLAWLPMIREVPMDIHRSPTLVLTSRGVACVPDHCYWSAARGLNSPALA